MTELIVFAVLSVGIIYVSRASLRAPRSHGFYRFLAWECILALFLLNVHTWFRDPFSWHQIVSWLLLIGSIIPLALGVHSLATKGQAAKHREDDAQLLAFEKTTTLVTTGVYRYIRHPLYSSLLFLAWGIFFKAPSWAGALLVSAATFFLVITAKTEEGECVRFFGPAYQAYMRNSRMFVPFIF